MPNGTPVSGPITAGAGIPGTYALPGGAKVVTVLNRSTNEVFVTVDGTTPTVNGPNQWFLPASSSLDIPVPTSGTGPGVTLRAVSAAALSLWVEVDE